MWLAVTVVSGYQDKWTVVTTFIMVNGYVVSGTVIIVRYMRLRILNINAQKKELKLGVFTLHHGNYVVTIVTTDHGYCGVITNE